MIKNSLLLALIFIVAFIWSCGKTGESQPNNYINSRMAYLKVKLNLDQGQVDKIKAIFAEEGEAIAKMRSSDSDDPRSAFRGIRERQDKTTEQVQAILTDTQKETYTKLVDAGVNNNNFIELQAKLDLTIAQSDSIIKVYGGMRRNMQARRGEGGRSGDRESRMMNMRAAREETDRAILKFLNDDQKKLYEKLQEERMEEMRRRFEGRQGGMWE